jgi:hypothetical protein
MVHLWSSDDSAPIALQQVLRLRTSVLGHGSDLHMHLQDIIRGPTCRCLLSPDAFGPHGINRTVVFIHEEAQVIAPLPKHWNPLIP